MKSLVLSFLSSGFFDSDVLIPLFVCVVLPIAVVWINSRNRQKEIDRKAEVMLKSIEAGIPIPEDCFKTTRETKGIKERLLGRLTGACITSLLGVAFLAVGIPFANRFGWSLNESPVPLLVVAGAILLAVGIALFIVYFIGKRMYSDEMNQ